MTRPLPDCRRLLTALLGALVVALALPAQQALGPGEDAWTLPGGIFRFGVAPRLLSATDMFGANGVRGPLGGPYSGLLGVAAFPTLQSLEGTIGSLSGQPAFRVILGTARANLQQAIGIIPFELSAGVTNRITFRVSAPFFTGEQQADWMLDGSTASVGMNPDLLSAGAAPLNAGLLDGLDSAATSLEHLADGCVVNAASDPRCAQVTGNLAAVRALIAQARTMSDGIAQTYGGRTTVPPSLFVPLLNSAAHSAIVAQIGVLRSGFAEYGTASVAAGAAPAAPGAPLTANDLRTLLADSTYGYGPGAVNRRYRQGFGDMDVGVSFLVYNGLKSADKW